MAASKWKVYDTFKLKLGQGLIDLSGDTFKCALFTSASNANTLTHDELADLTNEVANGFGYTTGGVTLTGVTWTNNAGVITFTSADPQWLASGGSIVARYAVIYDDTVSGDPLVCVCQLDIGGNVTALTGEFLTIGIDADGILTLSGATTN